MYKLTHAAQTYVLQGFTILYSLIYGYIEKSSEASLLFKNYSYMSVLNFCLKNEKIFPTYLKVVFKIEF